MPDSVKTIPMAERRIVDRTPPVRHEVPCMTGTPITPLRVDAVARRHPLGRRCQPVCVRDATSACQGDDQ